ncbi:MAG: hypothetical protein HQK89_14355 [Nitrospirae bacterium]|nr:hypothetical protein [Nitrospirota bacterium]
MFIKANTSLKLLFLALILLGLTMGCQKEKPAVGTQGGEYSMSVPEGIELMPWHHMPIKEMKEHDKELNKETTVNKYGNIKANHMDLIKCGKARKEGCLVCHYEPDAFCNKCHDYAGVPKVFPGLNGRSVLMLEIPDGIPAPPSHSPLDKWRATHDRAIIYGGEKITDCFACHPDPDTFCNKCHVSAGLRKINKP